MSPIFEAFGLNHSPDVSGRKLQRLKAEPEDSLDGDGIRRCYSLP